MNVLLILGAILAVVMGVAGCKYWICVAGVTAVVLAVRGRLGKKVDDDGVDN